jgi:hypothetical protein
MLPSMDDRQPRLTPGAQIRCPHCRRWHPVIERHAEGTPYARRMLYWECRGGFYYAGQIDTLARFPTRPAAAAGRVSTE